MSDDLAAARTAGLAAGLDAASARHLLVTNDFPPKHGGIQSYLWELWRRLPAGRAVVLTTAHQDAAGFDAIQPFETVRSRRRVLLPTPSLAREVREAAAFAGASLVVLDPALPVGWIGARLGLPYAVVLHGAEITVPGRLPGTRQLLAGVLRGAKGVIAAGAYPAAEARRAAGRELPSVHIPPGVDTNRFRPLDAAARVAARRRLGLPATGPLVVSVSRLVPRKGMDVLVEAAALLGRSRPELVVAIGGAGRDRDRLERLAHRAGAPVVFLGRVPDDDLPDLYGCADVFAMVCRDRWGGLEQEGFGIVFLEAAACGVPQVAGRSGGAHEAVADGETGVVVDHPSQPNAVAAALASLLDDDEARASMGRAARRRAVEVFDYDVLAPRLDAALAEWGG